MMKFQIHRHIPAFFLGFLALSFQIILMREFSAHFYGSEITFGILLSSWLLWTGVGSLYAPRMAFTPSRFQRTYYLIIIMIPFCLLGLRFSRFIMHILPGEIIGTLPLLIFSFVLTFLVCFPMGALFVFNVHYLRGNLKQVYFSESIGAAVAGLVIYFLLIPSFSNWQTLSFLGGCTSFSIFFSSSQKKNYLLFPISLLVLAIFGAADLPSQKLYWKPFTLIESKDSPYGKLQLLKDQEQISLYDNNILIYSYPDFAAAEESVHFALLQYPEAKKVLIIGGGAGGTLEQVLKYPKAQVDYVELDPEIIRLSQKYLPAQEKNAFQNPRIHIYYSDGRSFLNRHKRIYDVIILNLPEPSSAQINRFYTREFFTEIRKKLTSQGVFSFRVPSAENYISSELQDFLSSLYSTLRDVFPCIEIVPGSTNIFVASSRSISLQLEELNQRIESLKLNNLYVSPPLLSSRLDAVRIEFLKQRVYSGRARRNFDLTPISYFFNSVLWSAQFQGIEAKLLTYLSEIQAHWLLDAPLILFVIFGFVLTVRRKKSPLFLAPITIMGLTTIIIEIVVIIAFQSFHGYLYKSLAVLFAFFMFGLSAGAYIGLKRRKIHSSQLLLRQASFIPLLFILLFILEQQWHQLFYVILFALGLLGGDLFIIANHLFLKNKTNYGVGYGLDLIGSFLGALVTSTLLIPVLGLVVLVKYLLILNSLCVIFLFWGLKKQIA